MKIDDMMKRLREIRKEHGNIEVTCTGSLLPDDGRDIFETTVENLIVTGNRPRHGKAVRVWL